MVKKNTKFKEFNSIYGKPPQHSWQGQSDMRATTQVDTKKVDDLDDDDMHDDNYRGTPRWYGNHQ